MILKNNFFLLNLLFFFLSFLGSVYQSQFVYDPFHWGLSQSSIDLFSDLKPYKEIFIHYGFFYTISNSLVLEIFNNDLISTMYLSSLFFALGNFFLCHLGYSKLKIKTVYFLPILLFLAHPFANHPWYNYQFYFLIVLSIFFLIENKRFSLFFTGTLLSLSCLVYENFIYLGILLIITIFFFQRNSKKKYLLLLGFLLPQAIFHLYLLNNNLHPYWIKTFWLNEVFLIIYDLTFFELIYRYLENFLTKSIFNFFSEPYYFLFLIILLVNSYFFIRFIFFEKKNFKKNNINICLFILSLVCLFSYASTLHKLNIFRFSTGPIIGVLVMFYFIEKNYSKYKNYLLTLILVILVSSSFVPIKQENNRFFPLFEDITNNYSSKNLVFFKSQKWRKETWDVLNEIDRNSYLISLNCPKVTNFMNFTEDAFIYMIANQYINSNQYLFWYEDKKFYRLLSNHFNKNINLLIDDISKLENGIIFFNLKDKGLLSKKIDSKNFDYIEFPYSYQQKRKGLMIPKNCLEKIN
ncbi:hypothetical protein OAY51_02460 [Candidatus Pelagibacter sp.]|nr:hypothetical protein [Candidatus Pelagibacter sp.]